MIDKKDKSKLIEEKFKLAYETALKLPRAFINTRKNPQNKQVITIAFGTPLQISFFYEGEARGNFPDGLGKMTYQVLNGNLLKDNRVIYEGEFLGGEPNGKGKLTIREIDGDVIYESSEINTDKHKSSGEFKGLNLKAEGFFNYKFKKNSTNFKDGNEFLFKDDDHISLFDEFGAKTFISGEDLNYKLQYDKYKEFYWFTKDRKFKIIYQGEISQFGLHQDREKHKKCASHTFPFPYGKGELTYINLDKNSGYYYNLKQKFVGSFKHLVMQGKIKEYRNDVLTAEGNYIDGKRDGKFKFYDEDGTSFEEIFENGEEKK